MQEGYALLFSVDTTVINRDERGAIINGSMV